MAWSSSLFAAVSVWMLASANHFVPKTDLDASRYLSPANIAHKKRERKWAKRLWGDLCRTSVPVRMTWARFACPTQPYRSVSTLLLWDCCTAPIMCQEYDSRVPSIWVRQRRARRLPRRSSAIQKQFHHNRCKSIIFPVHFKWSEITCL